MEDGEETIRKITYVNSDLSQVLVGLVIISFCMLFQDFPSVLLFQVHHYSN